jgi:parallel beta-helix repeat protein
MVGGRMKRILTIGVILLFIGSIWSSTGFNLEKDSPIPLRDGKTLYVGGSGPGNYSKIQDAIDNASDGDIVFVYDDSSPYVETLIVNKSIRLIGENKHTTVIKIEGNDDHIINAHRVNVNGFTLLGNKHAIIDISANNIIISNNTIDQIILIHNCYSNNSVISHNRITKASIDVLWDNIIISDNIISDCDNFLGCIYVGVTGCSNITIIGNEINNSSYYGIWIFRRLYDCIISNNKISNNSIALTIDESNDILISRNIFDNNNVALRIGDCNNINISENAFIKNHHGIHISGPGYPNYIYHNNFIRNMRNAHFSFGSINNKWDGNYWNRPRFLPKPIFGSIVFSVPNWINFDWCPAKVPYDIWV